MAKTEQRLRTVFKLAAGRSRELNTGSLPQTL